MGTIWPPLLTDLFLNLHDSDFIQNFPKDIKERQTLAKFFYVTFRYIDGVLSLKTYISINAYISLIAVRAFVLTGIVIDVVKLNFVELSTPGYRIP